MCSRFLILSALMLSTILIGGSGSALAQDESVDPAALEADQTVSKLVGQLSSTKFRERQQAAIELLKLDAKAIPHLESAIANATGETAARLRSIVTQLSRRLFDARLQVFTNDLSEVGGSGLPEWDRFSMLAGSGKDALTIFHEVMNAEPGLFATRLYSPSQLPVALEARSAEFSRLCHGRMEEQFPIASCVALMLLGSHPETRLVRATSTNISDALDDPRFNRLISEGVHARTVRAVTSEWLTRPGISADRPLLFSIRHELPAGRSVARRIIASQSRRQDMYFALLCLCRLNDPEDLPLVESLLETPTTLWPPRGQTVEQLLPDREVGSNFSVQTRDVALVVAIRLRGANPEDFGITVQVSDVTVYVVESLGFDNDDKRAASLAKYRSLYNARDINPQQ